MGLCALPDPSGCNDTNWMIALRDAVCLATCENDEIKCVPLGTLPPFDNLWTPDCQPQCGNIVFEDTVNPTMWWYNGTIWQVLLSGIPPAATVLSTGVGRVTDTIGVHGFTNLRTFAFPIVVGDLVTISAHMRYEINVFGTGVGPVDSWRFRFALSGAASGTITYGDTNRLVNGHHVDYVYPFLATATGNVTITLSTEGSGTGTGWVWFRESNFIRYSIVRP